MAKSILYQNECQTVTLIDIPRSIELAQGSDLGRLVSSAPLQKPYASVEPKSAKAIANLEPVSIEELFLHRHLQLAVEEVRDTVNIWCLPRVKEQKVLTSSETLEKLSPIKTFNGLGTAADQTKLFVKENFDNVKDAATGTSRKRILIPPGCTYISGNIEDTCHTFIRQAPQFNVVIMDPPWPNRSVRRKQSYSTPYGTSDIRDLLYSIPVRDCLAEDALVGVWVTNKPAFRKLLLESGGMFEQWGLQLVEEWVWLKVTESGEPICALDSTWRKPYEILLLGKKSRQAEFKRRVIIAVPDLHSRKPNLKALLEPMLPPIYEAIEIFGRNLTAGWWAWGDEVLKFQSEDHWHNTI